MRVGFDIGGTFTDIVVVDDDGHLSTTKVLSLLETIGESIVHRVNATADNAKVDAFVHGTTIASNAVIEDTVARTGLITTEGFRDELEMRGQRRPNIYDAEWDRLPPLVPRSLRLEVAERGLGDAHMFALSHAANYRSDCIGRVSVCGNLKVHTKISADVWIIQMGGGTDSNQFSILMKMYRK